ncbi:MAG TPA: AraC family transcriptional regulator [Syntrophomonadaceae bacterium]|nr:AraC family transcriptional regulator [Syntrophomonadaceae bacterium]HQE24012.1 AraC family transcriptional regulator [Syntrophomonadaceae bacterium]
MRDIAEKVSYLQGLSEGLNISEGSPQGKIISGILSVLEELSDTVINLQCEMDEFREYVESIDDDLFDLEESIYDDDEDLVELECQHCGEELVFDADILEDDDVIEVICPNCNEIVYVNDGSFDYDPAYIENDLDDQETDSTHSCCD